VRACVFPVLFFFSNAVSPLGGWFSNLLDYCLVCIIFFSSHFYCLY
jgi:hypothetical protein